MVEPANDIDGSPPTPDGSGEEHHRTERTGWDWWVYVVAGLGAAAAVGAGYLAYKQFWGVEYRVADVYPTELDGDEPAEVIQMDVVPDGAPTSEGRAFDPDSGKTVWAGPTAPKRTGVRHTDHHHNFVRIDSTIFTIPWANTVLTAFDARSGRIQWKKNIPESSDTPRAIRLWAHRNRVLVVSRVADSDQNYRVTAFRPEGTVAWARPFGSRISHMEFDDGWALFQPFDSDSLHAVELRDNTLRTFETQPHLGPFLLTDSGTTYFWRKEKKQYALYRLRDPSGEPERYSPRTSILDEPYADFERFALYGDLLVCTLDDPSRLVAWNLNEKRRAWSYDLPEGFEVFLSSGVRSCIPGYGPSCRLEHRYSPLLLQNKGFENEERQKWVLFDWKTGRPEWESDAWIWSGEGSVFQLSGSDIAETRDFVLVAPQMDSTVPGVDRSVSPLLVIDGGDGTFRGAVELVDTQSNPPASSTMIVAHRDRVDGNRLFGKLGARTWGLDLERGELVFGDGIRVRKRPGAFEELMGDMPGIGKAR